MPNIHTRSKPQLPPGNSIASIRALQMALVQLCIRTPKLISPAFARTLSRLSTADASELARRISNWLGRPHHCRKRACRRARTCQGGRPPDCWRHELPPLDVEVDLATVSFELQMREAGFDIDGATEPLR